jgi:predicted nucleic acid-binding protein
MIFLITNTLLCNKWDSTKKPKKMMKISMKKSYKKKLVISCQIMNQITKKLIRNSINLIHKSMKELKRFMELMPELDQLCKSKILIIKKI